MESYKRRPFKDQYASLQEDALCSLLLLRVILVLTLHIIYYQDLSCHFLNSILSIGDGQIIVDLEIFLLPILSFLDDPVNIFMFIHSLSFLDFKTHPS